MNENLATNQLLTEEMHEANRTHIEYFADHGFKIKGIVHVGANTGQEIPWYLSRMYLPIIAFEPHPAAFKELHRIYHQYAICSPFALGSKSERLTLRVPEDENHERTSKYQPILTEGHDWTKVPMSAEFEIQCVRFDAWVRTHSNVLDITAYDTMVIDVQGMELEVLKGIGGYMKGFHFLSVECSASPMYDGEASAQEVIDFLATKGFMQLTPIEEHDDILFKRKGIWD